MEEEGVEETMDSIVDDGRGFEEVMPVCQRVRMEPDLHDKEMPFPRSGHRLVANDRYAVVIGGFNPTLWSEQNSADTYYPILKEIWLFNLATHRWKKLETAGSMPKELASHAALLHDNHVLVYGGTGVPFGHNSSNKLHVLDMKTNTWRLLSMATVVDNAPAIMPPEQYGHSFVRHKNKLYVIGGTSGFDYNMQVFELKLGATSTTNPKGEVESRSLLRGAELTPRYRHESFYFNEKLHVLGGGKTNTVCSLENVDVFDIATGLWSSIPIQADPVKGHPAPRRCHGLAVYEDSASAALGQQLSVYISGGYNGTQTFDDVWELKVSRAGSKFEYKWCKFRHDLPVPLYFHSMAVTPSGSLLIFGGVDGDTEDRSATLYRCYLKPPSLLELSLRKVIESVGDVDEKRLLQIAVQLHFPQPCVDWLKNCW